MNPMDTFNPDMPCRVHDKVNDHIFEWNPQMDIDISRVRGDLAWRRRGLGRPVARRMDPHHAWAPKRPLIGVNFDDSSLLKETFDRVRAEADRLITVIAETLRSKFPVDVPADLNSQLKALSFDVLDAMFKRSINANSVDEIWTVPSPAAAPGHTSGSILAPSHDG
jgi:hypothetical protein